MKKFTVVAIFLFAVMTCFAEHVKNNEAIVAARTFLKNNNAEYEALKDISVIAAFDNIYVFTTENSFVIMPVDDCVRPVLGYSLTKGFDAADIPANMRSWIENYSAQIQHAIDNSAKASADIKKMWDDLKNEVPDTAKSITVVEPLLTTTWNQNYPYNYFCPADVNAPDGRVYAGCLATAMAQVMKYWNYPETGEGSYSYTHYNYGTLTANFGETTYNWDLMPDYITYDSPQENIDAVATLIYHCGISVDMDYGPYGSSAYYYKVPNVLKTFFKYSSATTLESKTEYSDEGWIAMLKSELDEGRPLYYCGNNENNGHAFVCDGYRSDDYFHINWGWSGYLDDYWAMGALNPDPYTFNLWNMAVRFLEPIYDLPAPTLSVSAQQRTNVLSWNAVSGAVSYDIYRDSEKIATAYPGTEYIDTDVDFCFYYKYYIRAIGADNSKSNPSNIVGFKNYYRNIAPTDLSASLIGDNVELSWTGYEGNISADLRYGLNNHGFTWGYMGDYDTYWGQKYPASMLSGFKGMYVDKVSVFITEPNDYKLYLYKNNTTTVTNQLLEEDFTAYSIGWYDIELSNPISIDVTTSLWVVFYCDMSVWYPIAYGDYSGPDVQYARYLATNLTDVCYNYLNFDVSWLIKTHVTDGDYSYNIYRDGSLIANNQHDTSFIDSNLSEGIYTYYVTTTYNNGESGASNEETVIVGDPLTIVSENVNEDFLVYPNPAKDMLLIDNMENVVIQCDITTIGGRVVYSKNNCSSRFEVDVHTLPSGVYIIKLYSESSVYTGKFIKE